LLRIKSHKPDVLYIASYGKDVGLALKQAHEIGLKSQVICPQACQNPELIEVAGKTAEGLLAASPGDKVSEVFAEMYFKKFAEQPNFLVLRMHDAMMIALELKGKCAEDQHTSSCLLSSLKKIANFPGLSYPINFDGNGDINDHFSLKIVRNAAFSPLGDNKK